MKVALLDADASGTEVIARAFSLRGHHVQRTTDPSAPQADLAVLDASLAPDAALARCRALSAHPNGPVVWVLTRDRDGRRWVNAGAGAWVSPSADPQWLEAHVLLAERQCFLRRELVARGAEAERERFHAQLLLSDRWAAVGTLAAGAAHEINNPLTIVYANLEFLARSAALSETTADPDRRRKVESALGQCRAAAERVRQIVRNLLTFARADHDGKVPVFVEEVLESAAGLCANDLSLRARVVRDFHPVPPVEANPARLAQVFLNLVLNAIKAIPEGHPEDNSVTFTVDLSPNGLVRVSVADTGAGIAAEHLDHVFDPFFTTRAPGDGLGLGLFVCQNLVSELGGEITVDSRPGHGTVFRVLLPASRPAPPHTQRPVPAPPRRASVLLLDDEANLRFSLSQLLAVDHDVTSLGTAREAIDLIAHGQRFNVILCDLMMPGISGIDFYAWLQREAPDQVPRVIFLSGGAFTPRAQAFLDGVPNPRIEKPFDLDELKSLIQRTLANTPSTLPSSA